jgi:hypothetical protein
MERNTLTYNRTDLVKMLQEKLDEKVAAETKSQKEYADKRKETRDAIVKLLDSSPGFVDRIETAITDIVHGVMGGNDAIDSEQLAKNVKAYWGPSSDTSTDTMFGDLRRLIRVYDTAVDEQVQVAPGDDVYYQL